jgi:hypothetical protein
MLKVNEQVMWIFVSPGAMCMWKSGEFFVEF